MTDSAHPFDRYTLWRQALWCFAHGFPKCGRRYLLKVITGG